MKPNQIFNPSGDDRIENRSIWFGDTTNLMQLNDIRYNWALSLYQQMRDQFWIPQKIDVTQDITDYRNLTTEERKAYNGVLSYLTFLDSIQTCNIPHLKSTITAPEVGLCLSEQISQEAMHSSAYQYLIETIIPTGERGFVYEFWRTDKVLKDRCEFIAQYYQAYLDNPNRENYFTALLADYLLEGIYFYNGFQFFFTLASRHLMGGSSDNIKLIKRDELSHVRLYQKLIPEAMMVLPHSTDRIYEMFDTAVNQECLWTNHVIGNNILGINEGSTEKYTKYLANTRLRAIGLDNLYPGFDKDPYKHLEKQADVGSEGNVKANFFDGTVTSYSMSSAVTGWDDF